MNQEQFGQFWEQLRMPLAATWERVTVEDLNEIQGDLAKFGSVLQRRYGELYKEDVNTWANRRYSHWAGNYAGYEDAESFVARARR
jgi:conjugal transfer/entry exclusion protein